MAAVSQKPAAAGGSHSKQVPGHDSIEAVERGGDQAHAGALLHNYNNYDPEIGPSSPGFPSASQ